MLGLVSVCAVGHDGVPDGRPCQFAPLTSHSQHDPWRHHDGAKIHISVIDSGSMEEAMWEEPRNSSK